MWTLACASSMKANMTCWFWLAPVCAGWGWKIELARHYSQLKCFRRLARARSELKLAQTTKQRSLLFAHLITNLPGWPVPPNARSFAVWEGVANYRLRAMQ